MPELHPIFQDCCSKKLYNSQWRMTEPYRNGDFIYATDGRICVRMPAADVPEFVTLPDSWKRPDPKPIFSKYHADRYETSATEIPDVVPRGLATCMCCNGSGCRGCEKGKVEVYMSVCLRPDRPSIRDIYAAMLKRHGAELFATRHKDRRYYESPYDESPYRFTIPGTNIDGLLMPMLEEK